jgi:hypothetical protein
MPENASRDGGDERAALPLRAVLLYRWLLVGRCAALGERVPRCMLLTP